jgi:endonuclease/exonuclease/phosphatase family metal-dependent hydrolase
MEWALATALAGWAAARLAGADRLRFAEAWTVPLLSFTPQVTAGAWASALLLRGGPAAAAAAAGAALTVVVGPRAVQSRQPPAAGPTLSVLTANLLLGRAAPEAVVELVRRTRPDALFVQELTSEAAARLQRAGLGDLLAHGVAQPMPNGARGSGIYARYPLRRRLPADSLSPSPVSAALVSAAPVSVAPVSAARCTARLELPFGQFVQLACIHAGPPRPPWSPGATARWRGQLAALPPPGAGPVILAGDFNATLDHAQFRRLLRRGYADAASQAGQGLVHTWGPRPDWRLTLLAIDHVLVDRRCQVLTTSAHRVTGSDHLALYAELRLPAPAQITARSTE